MDVMTYALATAEQIRFFSCHGYLVVENAIPRADLDELEGYCERLLEEKERLANDWAWDAKESLENRSFRIVQSSPSFVWREIRHAAYRQWLVAFASSLMNQDLEFWYDQFLAKPPGNSMPTYWHQDEGYWGRNLDDRAVTGWIPLQDVDAQNGCMQFIDGGHKLGVLPHHRVEGMQSDLLTCEVNETDTVICPIKRGDVTFHHSKTPHMTNANLSTGWRRAVTNHMQAKGSGGEGDHYPWKVTVDQKIGQPKNPKSS
jgi:phytanoyl-CoA hydroxylase